MVLGVDTPNPNAATIDPESAAVIAGIVGESNQQNDVPLIERDLATGTHDVFSELRRVSDVAGSAFGMEDGDLSSVTTIGAYVLSSCIDRWCTLANLFISKKKERNIIIISCPTSESIFYRFKTDDNKSLEEVAKKWAAWKTLHLTHLLIPVNLRNVHWCLLVVDLHNRRVACWDSLLEFDQGAYVRGKLDILFVFLRYFVGDDGNWDIVFELVPQQIYPDCGIFCIEFMRAVTDGCQTVQDVAERVSSKTIRAARSHIARELHQGQILRKSADANIIEGGRIRKKSKALDSN